MRKKKILLLILSLIVVGCKNDEETTETPRIGYYYDPRIPFGTIDFNNMEVRDVTNFQADVSIRATVKLTWNVPPLYTTMNYKVVIFKRRQPPVGFNIICPKPVGELASLCPNDEGNVSPLYKVAEVTGNQWVDQNSIDEDGDEIVNLFDGENYSYWAFVYLVDQNKYSKGVRLDITTKEPGDTFQFPILTEFWNKKRFSYGIDPAVPTGGGSPINSLYSLSIGNASLGDIKGGIAITEGGNLMYVADSSNNRVVIYSRDGINCETIVDDYERMACQLQYSGQPLTARNILGQSTGENTGPCGSPGSLGNNECLNNPTKVKIINNRLFISDSGNNRIVVHDGLPQNGCLPEPVIGQPRPLDCTPNWVIGKAGLFDLNNYAVETFGDASLNYPTDVVAKDGELYIADTNNHRVVKVSNYTNRDLFNCTAGTWSTNLCKFSAVLGQPDFFTKENFKDLVASRLAEPSPFYVIDQNGIRDTIVDPYKSYLRRHFRKPTKIMFSKDNKLLIAANEEFEANNALGGRSSLYGRIMVYNNNPIAGSAPVCNLATYSSGPCDANDVIGSKGWDKLETVGSPGAVAYNQVQYGIYGLVDFELIEVLSDDENQPSTEMLIAIDVIENSIHVWNNWLNKVGDGYPRTGKINNPQGAINPETQQSLPILESICSIKFESSQNSIFITDCGDSRVHEISLSNLGI